jgi:DNA-binding CsgD family transcriptional regulator
MSLSPGDWQKINGCLIRLYQELDCEKQPRLMLQIINELVPTDSSALNIFKPHGEMSAITLPEKFATPEQVSAVGRYTHQSPFASYFFATQDFSWMMPTDFIPQEDFYKLDLYQQGQKPLNIQHHMVGFIAQMEETAHALSIHRSEKGFEEREREILNTIQPHVVNSYINAIVHSRAKSSLAQIKAAVETAPGAYGHFDSHGKVVWLQEKACVWLNDFFPAEVKHDGKIPFSIRKLLDDSARENNLPKKLEQPGQSEILTVCLGASPVGGWVMRLERRPRKFFPRFQPLPQFSERKNEVLKWMVEGKRNAEIGRTLHISERTVEKHVAEILAEFKVENRATAIIRAMEFSGAENQRINR